MRILAALVTGASLLFSGCAMGPTTVTGFIYSDLKYPSYYDGASENGPGSKVGTAESKSYLGFVALGDSSIMAACQTANIKKIHTVDHHYFNVLGFYCKWTTIVTGE